MRLVSLYRLALGACAFVCSLAEAQVLNAGIAGRPSAARTELDSLAARAEALASSPSGSAQARAEKQREAEALRRRLKNGDFEVGDEIAVSVRGDSVLSDTFQVQLGGTLLLPSLPELSLVGVLRSELESRLDAHIAQYLKDKRVRAITLVRFGVLGEVARPGYYWLPPTVRISDAIMAAGGPTPRADLQRTFVRRGSRELLSKSAVRAAMVEGLTLDKLNLDAGDELVVRAKREWGWQTVAQAAALTSGIVLSLRAFR